MADDGFLEYYSLKTIQAGEEVSFSYLSDLYETPTLERRQLLWQNQIVSVCLSTMHGS
jgi:hypothetical protein